jgi:hypothetical protein
VTTCDFTAADGGGCDSKQKCIPNVNFGLADVAKGFCAALAPTPIALGQHCMQTLPDPCDIGLTCAGNTETGNLCRQLCTNPGSNCADGTPCQGYTLQTGAISTAQGICVGTATY